MIEVLLSILFLNQQLPTEFLLQIADYFMASVCQSCKTAFSLGLACSLILMALCIVFCYYLIILTVIHLEPQQEGGIAEVNSTNKDILTIQQKPFKVSIPYFTYNCHRRLGFQFFR